MAKVTDKRQKNAKTIHEVADYQEGGAEQASYSRLGKMIHTITDESEETINSQGYYDGDGTLEETVDDRREKYTFEGFYDPTDPAQKLIVDKRNETGDGRKVFYKITRPTGEIETSVATVTNIVFFGGIATDYAPFRCTIARNEKPTITGTPSV